MEVHTHKPHCKTFMFWQSNIYLFSQLWDYTSTPKWPQSHCCFQTLAFSFVGPTDDFCSVCEVGLCFVNRIWYSSCISGRETCSSWASIISSSSSVLMTIMKEREEKEFFHVSTDEKCTDNENPSPVAHKKKKSFTVCFFFLSATLQINSYLFPLHCSFLTAGLKRDKGIHRSYWTVQWLSTPPRFHFLLVLG